MVTRQGQWLLPVAINEKSQISFCTDALRQLLELKSLLESLAKLLQMAHRLLNTFLQENNPLFFALLNFN
jgi:hypothetical protein